MTATQSGPESVDKTSPPFPWITIASVAALLLACYAPLLFRLGQVWANDADMGHGVFVPLIAGYIAWQKRSQVEGIAPQPNWWGLAVMMCGALQLYLGTLGAELYKARTSIVI